MNFPIPQVLEGLTYVITGQPCFHELRDLGKVYFFYHVGFHWFLLLLLFAKATIVAMHRLDLSAPVQIAVVGIAHTMATMSSWNWPPLPNCTDAGDGTRFEFSNECVFGQELHAYFVFTLVYIAVLHYARPFLHWCRDQMNALVAPSWRPLVSVALGLIAICAFYCEVTYVHDDFYWQLQEQSFYWLLRRTLEPVHVACASFFALLFVPSLSALSFIGRYALCVYIVHDHFGDFWLDGANIQGWSLFPRYERVLSKTYDFFPNKGIDAEATIAFGLCAVYALAFVLTVPFLVQNLVILAAEGSVKTYSIVREKIGTVAQHKKDKQ
jgi:hypothetical protein